MTKIIAKRLLAQANSVLVLGFVCGGLALCAFGAMAFDLRQLFVD
jgi:hypothetical protein